ncbi:hypothetical protein QTJ16_002050 [Diplocarpon rosae]|uniref:Alternative oxidase n=1 Tax=Diplocarpon rosae TaxID=946125 RepID=A0AAD9T4N5_9HELO|nr:hypothetical protein QTJ16_002050 [Diplocarpon rosae]PBP23065.1 alternative oxidase [Diplocarpon rosae]
MILHGVFEMISVAVRIKWWKYRYVFFTALVVNVVLINYFFFDSSLTDFVSPSYSLSGVIPTSSPQASVDAPPISPPTLSLEDYDFDGPYIGWPLARVCNETKWQPGFVFVCDNNSGGIGNIRNFILTCVRYAIDAGASGIIMPRIQRRSEDDLADLFTTSLQPFSYFFDDAHFRDAIGAFCPQMKIYEDVNMIPHHENKKEVTEFYPKDLNTNDGCDERGINRHLDHFRRKIDEWAIKYENVPSEARPVTLRFRWATFFEWPVMRDGPEFAATFGDLLRIRKDIQELAAATINEMAVFTGEKPNNSQPLSPPRYLGVHLRTENDALGFWPNFETQSEGYMEQAGIYNLEHAYLASGNASEGHRFGEIALNRLGLKTTSKTDLLKGDRLKQLNDLSWDQQALVDYLVLQKSTHFTGCSFSSFAMNIATKRHLMTDGIFSRAWRSPGDPYSTLVGRFDNWFGDWMFMLECMWP